MENRVKLNAHNYNGWSTTHMWILKEADAWDPILVAPEEMLKEDKATIQKNTTAMKILFTGMDEYHQILCARKTSAKQVWSFLKERYDKLSTDKLLDLQNDLAACQYEGEGQKYIDEITRLYDEIAMFNDVIETNSSSIKCKLLNSCNMPNVVTAIKAVGLENKTVSQIKDLILDEAKKLEKNVVFAANISRKNIFCNFCKKPGHLEIKCWKKEKKKFFK